MVLLTGIRIHRIEYGMGMDVFLVLMHPNHCLIAREMLCGKLLRNLQRQFWGDLAGLEGLDDVIILDAVHLTIVPLGFHHTADGVFHGAALAGGKDLLVCFIPIEDIADSHVQPPLSGEYLRNRHYRSATFSMSRYTCRSRNSASFASCRVAMPALTLRAI